VEAAWRLQSSNKLTEKLEFISRLTSTRTGRCRVRIRSKKLTKQATNKAKLLWSAKFRQNRAFLYVEACNELLVSVSATYCSSKVMQLYKKSRLLSTLWVRLNCSRFKQRALDPQAPTLFKSYALYALNHWCFLHLGKVQLMNAHFDNAA